jgi:hypothetical protein
MLLLAAKVKLSSVVVKLPTSVSMLPTTYVHVVSLSWTKVTCGEIAYCSCEIVCNCNKVAYKCTKNSVVFL